MVSHLAKVRAPKMLLAQPAPLLLQRSDARFMEAVRNELGDSSKRDALLDSVVRKQNDTLKLLQPIHRVFHLTLLEVVCDAPGEPRLDPAAIDSAGLVVRRVGGKSGEQAWMRAGANIQGWVDLEPEKGLKPGSVHIQDDPDVKRRKAQNPNPVLAEHLARFHFAPSTLSEDVTDLFILPPDVCSRAKSTLIYGMVPTASLDTIAAQAPEPFEAADVLADLPAYLKSAATLTGEGRGLPPVPFAGASVTRPTGAIRDTDLKAYADFVERVVAEYDLMGDTPGAPKLRTALDSIVLVMTHSEVNGVVTETTKTLLAHLQEVASVLVFTPDPTRGSAAMPLAWPTISPEQEQAIVAAVGDILRNQVAQLVSREGRFTPPNAQYVVRAFVRVRRDDGCPPALFWSKPTEPFTIAPWYENGPAGPPIVPLPDPFKDLSKFKPNVVFALPASISDIVHKNSAEDLLAGKGSRGDGLGLAWLCGFNIPLITLCAFIVLSIFLSLLNIIFWWLPLIRICIPIPASVKNKLIA